MFKLKNLNQTKKSCIFYVKLHNFKQIYSVTEYTIYLSLQRKIIYLKQMISAFYFKSLCIGF